MMPRNPKNTLPETTETIMALYKEPLLKVEGGYGYYGTVAYDKKTQSYIQCHICGKLFGFIHNHLKDVHNISTREYRERFGLPVSRRLFAPKYKTPAWEAWHSLTPEERKAKVKHLIEGRQKAIDEGKPMNTKRSKKALYYKNLEGRCPDQLLDKIKELEEVLGHPPTLREFAKKYGHGYADSVKRTFGTWKEALHILGLTPRSNQIYNREVLTQLLVDFKQMNGREAAIRDTQTPALPSKQAFYTHFGSWGKAKEIAYGKEKQ